MLEGSPDDGRAALLSFWAVVRGFPGRRVCVRPPKGKTKNTKNELDDRVLTVVGQEQFVRPDPRAVRTQRTSEKNP